MSRATVLQWAMVIVLAGGFGCLCLLALRTPTGYSEPSTLPYSAASDSPYQSTMAAAWATMAFVPTSTVTPTKTATVAPTETVGPTVLPYCATIQEGPCLMFESGNPLPTPTMRPCSATTPSPIMELPCDKYDEGLANRDEVK